jgi:hypothetical protein
MGIPSGSADTAADWALELAHPARGKPAYFLQLMEIVVPSIQLGLLLPCSWEPRKGRPWDTCDLSVLEQRQDQSLETITLPPSAVIPFPITTFRFLLTFQKQSRRY